MKKRMKKLSALLLAGVMCSSILLSGCGKEEAATGEGGEAVLEVWAWDVALMQLEAAADAYLEQNPDANVTFDFVEMGTDQIYDKLTTSLATGSGIADVIAIEGSVLASYANKFPEGFLDVSENVSADEFLPAKVSEVTLNGKVHAFPWDAGPVAMFYRSDYFEQAGVNPDEILTWDDYIEAGKKIEAVCKTPAGDPVKMLPMDPTTSSIYTRMRGMLGVDAFDAEGNPTVGSPESIAAMEEAKKVYDSGIALDYDGWSEYEQSVVNESVATIPEAVWMIGTIKDKAPQTEGKWGVMQMPAMEGAIYSTNNGGANVAINAKTDYPEEAKAFLDFAMKDTAMQAEGFEKYGLYPSFIASYDEEVFSQADPFFGEESIYGIFIENGQNVAELPVSPNYLEAADYLTAAASDIYLNDADVTERLTELQKELETKFVD